jgi:putative transposase
MTPEGLYGRRKMMRLIRRRMPATTPGAVDRAMKGLGLKGVRRAKGVRTAIPGKDGKRAGDLRNRDFTAPAPSRTWVLDFTYVRTWAGFVYTAFIVDVFAQKFVAWHCAKSKDVELVMTPLRMATWQREREGHPIVPGELVGHADAGSQYTSIRFTDHLELADIRPSIGSVGDAYDNALMESVIGLYKTECIRTTIFHNGPYRQLADVEWATAGWVDWYNNRRLHSSLDYLTPKSSSKPTTQHSTESRNPHRSGREPGALQLSPGACREPRVQSHRPAGRPPGNVGRSAMPMTPVSEPGCDWRLGMAGAYPRSGGRSD